MIRDSGPPPAHHSIGPELVRRLVGEQFPEFADLEVGARYDGWDMAMFRLGDALGVRLPRVEAAVLSLVTESRWLQELGRDWTFPHPRVVAMGEPGAGYPWVWTIVTWLPGETADLAPLSADAGEDVGIALAQVHSPAPADARFNVEQSIPLADRAENLEWALKQIAAGTGPSGERLDVAGARELWHAALAAPGPTERVWSHADAHGSNVLSHDGAFGGIIDFGKMAGCERAVDLSFLYTCMPAAGVDAAVAVYRESTGCDDAGLDARLRGIAVTKAASWAVLDRPLNIAMAWRAFEGLGLVL